MAFNLEVVIAPLSSKNPIGYIAIRVFAHATEDPEKVLTAVRNMLPPETLDAVAFKKSSLAGHHGNPIILFEARIKDKNAVQAIFGRIAAGLGIMDKEILNSEIESHLERGNLYLRLDKQSAYLNEARIAKADAIHFKIHFRKEKPKEILEICRKFGLLP
ncbi:MAG: RNA-binding domain-containing protein [Candidatus Bathyarchaeia archaeon]